MKLREDWRKRLDPNQTHAKPSIHVGPIAAGEKVVSSSSGAIAEYLKRNYGDTLGVEMEGQGFLAGVHINSPVQGCVVRGISDLLDGKAEADKAGSQERAADVASAVAFEMLATLHVAAGEPSFPDEERRIASVRLESPFPAAEAADGAARFRAPGEALGSLWTSSPAGYFSGQGVNLAKGPATWLRLMPTLDPKRTWTAMELKQAGHLGVALQPFIFSSLFIVWAEDGIGACNLLTPDASETNSVAFVFETGEVWAIDTWVLGTDPTRIVVTELEKGWVQHLKNYAEFLSRLGLPGPYRWIAGVSGVAHRRLAYLPAPGKNWLPDRLGPECLAEQIVNEGFYSRGQSAASALLPFFELIFRKSGLPRPEYLDR